MSEDTFTTDRLEAAIKKVAQPSSSTKYLVDVSDVIAELTKPVWTPKEGTFYAWRSGNQGPWGATRSLPDYLFDRDNERRPITASEIGLEPFEYLIEAHLRPTGNMDYYETRGYNKGMKHVNNTLFPDKE